MSASDRRLRVARLVVGYATVASALPYLGLKIVWLAGGQLGLANAAVMEDVSMVTPNAVTAWRAVRFRRGCSRRSTPPRC